MPSAARQLVARVLRPLLRAAEGEPRTGPWYLPFSGGWLSPNGGSSQIGGSLATI
jgi:hypothetical protein